MRNIRKEAKNETRCDHIPFYSPSNSEPSILAVEKPGRDDPNGRAVLAGGVCGRGWDRVSETIKKKSPGSGNSWGPMDVVFPEYYVLIIQKCRRKINV
jgi:hypothetical protein